MKLNHALAGAVLAAMCPVFSACAQVAVISESLIEHTASAGQSYTGRLLIQNTSQQPQEARIYQTDYVFTADGRSTYGAPGSTPRSNAKWMTVSPSYIVIQPGQVVPVQYTVTVPTDSSLTGSYWSMVMIEGIVPGSELSQKPATNRPQLGVTVTTRYGTQISTNIGSSGVAKVAFDSLTATADSTTGNRGLRFDFINTGERSLRFKMSLELYNEAGDLIKKASQNRGLLYPGTAARQKFDVGSVPRGTYTAVLVADAGGDRVFGGQFRITY